MTAIRPAQVLRGTKAVLEPQTPRLNVEIRGLPRTAIPNDLRRLCGKASVENVSSGAVEYRRFRPTGHGFLSFARPEWAAAATKALNKVFVGGKPVTAKAVGPVSMPGRSRGSKGLLEAAQRGVITGDGASGGVTGSGRNVVIFGLPGRIIPPVLAENLRGYKLATTEFGKQVIVKLDHDGKVTSSSRFLVRATTVSEAHRLVRTLHMQPWRPDLHGDKFTVRAFVVW
ncbi:hypothetical protein PYCCODRAFT_1416620 [Trametes coccinea BRFM310]|uniref:RRM domain-containing protein n=1 Tax=Trametes coccinea (strain BRFM310) TaxID=1353009 RepID=A0A1Y2IEX3_TRAC3|nr:hypothetical protein PYCCODRAFT_1416620 [Trametes coccinea BRFM310]